MALSLAVLTANGILMRRFFPPAPPAVAEKAEEAAKLADENGEEAQADLAGANDKKGPAGQLGDAGTPGESNKQPKAEAAAAADESEKPEDDELTVEPKLEYVTLGSVDEKSPFRMLATLTNYGAAVRRIELSSQRFLDMHDASGYLGHLELIAPENDDKGLVVQAVGGGTPAEVAGLKVGDRLIAAGTKETTPIESANGLVKLLAKTKPGRALTLIVERDGKQETLTAELGRRPVDVIRPEGENVVLTGHQLPPGFIEPPSLETSFEAVGKKKASTPDAEIRDAALRGVNWKIVDRGVDFVTFERTLPKVGLAMRKKFTLAKVAEKDQKNPNAPDYHLTLELTVENRSTTKAQTVAYRLDGPNGLPVEGWWWLGSASRAGGMREIVGRYFGADVQRQTAIAIASGKAKEFEGSALAYMGVDTQYFCVMLLPEAEAGADGESWISAVAPVLVGPKPAARSGLEFLANVTPRLYSKSLELAPGTSVTHSYQVFAGPKAPALLAQYKAGGDPAYSISGVCYYGWFGGIAKLMLAILHTFYDLVGNYGLAIIMLTVLVRGAMYPISRGQAKSMAKMQALKPEMDRIKEKYKGDQQKQAQLMQELYRKHQVNPLAGCLPIFLQLPVFVGLYRGLSVDVELRLQPLLGNLVRWCSNLAAPDMLWNWSSIMPDSVNSGQGFFGLGPYLNVLPLVCIGLYLLQQKVLMPPPANEQAAMQASMMKWMMIVFGILFYKVPSGLCLYMITTTLWSIGERLLIPPPTAPGSEPAEVGNAAKRIASGTSSNGAPAGKAKSKKRK
jgi:YidC/Oxa1 family membrane protein insertase